MEKKNSLDRDIDLKNYNDQTGISLREMNFGLWLSENRKRIIWSVIIFLIILSAFFFIFSSYNLAIYFFGNHTDTKANINEQVVSPHKLTKGLQVSTLQIFPHQTGKDLSIKLANPNDKFMANFKYCFESSDKDLLCGSDFIMPNENKYVLVLNKFPKLNVSRIKFKLKEVSWRRIDAHKIPNWASFSQEHLNFPIQNLNFSAGTSNNLSKKIDLNNLSFSISNKTPYSYYELPLNILLFRNNSLIGVNRYFLENFLAGETRDISISWAGDLRGVNHTSIKADLNILDDDVYLKYRGGKSN